MAGKGGYEPPMNPAPASGPGQMAQRTDGGPADPNANRRIAVQQHNQAKRAHAEAHEPTVASAPQQQQQQQQMTPQQARSVALQAPEKDFYRPSEAPGTPVTDGAATGPGRGPEALFNPGASGSVQQALEQIAPFDRSGAVQQLIEAARQQGV